MDYLEPAAKGDRLEMPMGRGRGGLSYHHTVWLHCSWAHIKLPKYWPEAPRLCFVKEVLYEPSMAGQAACTRREGVWEHQVSRTTTGGKGV